MKNETIYYSVGALLYCPANRKTIADLIINEKLGKHYSLALCLEDTINDNFVEEAENDLVDSLFKVHKATLEKKFYLPKIFIRVRNPEQIIKLFNALKPCLNLITGFIVPKFSVNNSTEYIQNIIKINELSDKKIYMMPIYENSTIINLSTRYELLYSLKDQIDKINDLILNIRVGGNDLCHAFGFRRHSNESIHDIKPISNIFADIITVYGMDYVVSGPVWEYYSGPNWEKGLRHEIKEDKLCGFIGKTIIHPNQIPVVNESYKVSLTDYTDAKSILNWDTTSNSLVSGNLVKERMNEFKTHYNWARQTLLLADAYGIKDN